MKRILLAALFAAGFGTSAEATPIVVLSGGCGTATPQTGQEVIFVDTTGNACSSASLSGPVTANTAATASATPTSITAGTGRALNESLHSGLFVELSQAGTLVATGSPLNVTTPNATQVTGNITSNQSVTLVNPGGLGTFSFDITGTWTGLIVVEANACNGCTFYPTTAVPLNSTAVGAFTANNAGQGSLASIYSVRLRGNTVGSGTATVTLNAGQGNATIMQDNLHWSTNIDQVNGNTALGGAGATGTGSLRVTAAQDTTTIAGAAPGTAGTASANVVTVQGVASMTPVQITQTPTTTGGLSVSRLQVANNTTSVAVKASAGQLYGIEAFNNSTTIAYVKLYNAAQGSTTCGSGTPVYQGMIPAPASGGGGYVSMNVQGLAFSTAITVCVTTGFADNDTGAPAASVYAINFFYK